MYAVIAISHICFFLEMKIINVFMESNENIIIKVKYTMTTLIEDETSRQMNESLILKSIKPKIETKVKPTESRKCMHIANICYRVRFEYHLQMRGLIFFWYSRKSISFSYFSLLFFNLMERSMDSLPHNCFFSIHYHHL